MKAVRILKDFIELLITRSIRSIRRKSIVSEFPFTFYKTDCKQTFFGYYDRTPFSLDDKKILAITVDSENAPLTSAKTASVGFFDLDHPNNFQELGKTSTWCWQLGCRLMWFPEDENNFVLYNKIVDNNYGCIVQNISNQKLIQKLNFPIYDLNKEGSAALTLNFSRLNRLRPGYGYVNFRDTTENELSPDNDGIWLCRLSDNKKELIIRLRTLSELEMNKTMDGAEHYVNHLCFNQSGNRFMFFHLWIKDKIKYNRAITSDLKGENLKILNKSGFVSHYHWKNDKELLIYSSINQKTGYYLFFDLSDNFKQVGDGLLNSDGHPTYFENEKLILTDTYPSRFSREQSLILFNSVKNKKFIISKIFSPDEFAGEFRCDLHPRLSRTERYICIDAPFKTGRRLVVFDIKDAINSIV